MILMPHRLGEPIQVPGHIVPACYSTKLRLYCSIANHISYRHDLYTTTILIQKASAPIIEFLGWVTTYANWINVLTSVTSCEWDGLSVKSSNAHWTCEDKSIQTYQWLQLHLDHHYTRFNIPPTEQVEMVGETME